MNVGPSAYLRQLQQAELDVDLADAALRADLARLKAHAGKPGSYSAPLGAFGALVAFRLLRRGPKPSAMAAAAAPAKAGIAALLLRLGLPAAMRFVREQAQAWQGGASIRAGLAGGGAGRHGLPLPRVSATLDRARFAGRWFEVARLVAASPSGRATGCEPASLVLVPVPDGFAVRRSTPVRDARRVPRVLTQLGVLRPTDAAGHPSELSLSWARGWGRWMPLAWHDFWVLEVDKAYAFALVGDRARNFLVVLSRTPAIDDAAWQQLSDTAAAEGYPVVRFERTAPGS